MNTGIEQLTGLHLTPELVCVGVIALAALTMSIVAVCSNRDSALEWRHVAAALVLIVGLIVLGSGVATLWACISGVIPVSKNVNLWWIPILCLIFGSMIIGLAASIRYA